MNKNFLLVYFIMVDKKKKRKAIRKRTVVKPGCKCPGGKKRCRCPTSGTKISIRINTADVKRQLPPASRGELITSTVSGETRLKTDVERLFQGEPSNVLVPLKKPLPAPALEAKTPPIPPAPVFKAPAKKSPQKIGRAIDISEPPTTDTDAPVKRGRGRPRKVEFIGVKDPEGLATSGEEGAQF
jgi:hypothetical protein|tara:strand:- start:973 stop:1524 length:552 start_codon:yes stop_codon:yes gene_type:complete